MAFFVVIFTPPNNVEAFVTIRGVAVSAGRQSLQNWSMVIEKAPCRVGVDTEPGFLLLRRRIRGPAFGMNGAKGTGALEKIRRNGVRIMSKKNAPLCPYVAEAMVLSPDSRTALLSLSEYVGRHLGSFPQRSAMRERLPEFLAPANPGDEGNIRFLPEK